MMCTNLPVPSFHTLRNAWLHAEATSERKSLYYEVGNQLISQDYTVANQLIMKLGPDIDIDFDAAARISPYLYLFLLHGIENGLQQLRHVGGHAGN